jgi:hypothetical protein
MNAIFIPRVSIGRPFAQLAMFLTLAGALTPAESRADLIYQVTVPETNTLTSLGSPYAPPYSVDFQLTNPNPTGVTSTTITLYDFSFGGGSAIAGTSSSFGSVLGNLDDAGGMVRLTDPGFFDTPR